MSSSALWTLSHSYYIVIIIHKRHSVCECVISRVSEIVWPFQPYGNSNNNRAVNESLYSQSLSLSSSWSASLWCEFTQSPRVYKKKNVQRVKNYRYCCWRRTATRPQKLLLACTINIIEFCFCRSCIFLPRFSSPSETAWQPLLSAYSVRGDVAFAPIYARKFS